MAPQMFSAPGHYQSYVSLALAMFSALGTITKFTTQYSSSAWVGPGFTSLDSFQSVLGWHKNFPLCCGVPCGLPCSPWEQSGLWLYWSQCPLLVTGQSPTSLLVCVMVSCTAWCWPVSLTANDVHLLAFFCWKKLCLVWLLVSAAGQPTCASWWYCLLSWGWLAMSPSSWVLHLQVWGPIHMPWAHIGCQITLLWIYHPIWEGLLMH